MSRTMEGSYRHDYMSNGYEVLERFDLDEEIGSGKQPGNMPVTPVGQPTGYLPQTKRCRPMYEPDLG